MVSDETNSRDELLQEIDELRASLATAEEQVAGVVGSGFDFPSLAKAFDSSQMSAMIVHNGIVEQANQVAAEMFGYASVEDVIGGSVMSFVAPSSHAVVTHRMGELAEGRSNPPVVIELLNQDGNSLFVQSTSIPIQVDGQSATLIIGHDVTQQRLAEQALQHEQQRAATYLEVAAAMMLGLDTDGRITMLNPSGCELLGLTEEEAIGWRWVDHFVPAEHKQEATQTFQEILAGKTIKHKHNESWVRTIGGDRRLIAWQNSPVRDADGNIVGILSSGQDITDRRQAEESLRRSHERLQSIFRAAPIGIGVVVDRVLVRVNQTLCQMLGYTADDMLNRNARFLYPSSEEYERVGREKYAQIERWGIGTVETEWKQKNGRVIDVILSSSVIDPDDLTAGVTFTALDITEQKQAQEDLNQFFHQSAVLLCIAGFNGKLRRFNPAFQKILGYSEEELASKSLIELIHSDDREAALEMFENMKQGNPAVSFRNRYRTKDGDYRILEWTTTPDVSRGLFYGIAKDVTERHLLEEQLQHSQKMDSIGQLAGGVAHEFNNQLTAIMGFGELLARQTNNENSKRFAAGIVKSAKQSAKLTMQLLAFSRKGKCLNVAIDLHAVIADVMDVLAHTIDRRIILQQDLQAELSVVEGDSSQLHNVFLNLGLNARDAMPDGGSLTIRTRNVEIGPDQVTARHLELAQGDYIQVEVIDAGEGVPAHLHDRIFEPFFTTKEVGQGSGMGLAAVYGAVKSHRGAVSVDSRAEQGSCFTVLLPVAQRKTASTVEEARPMVKACGDFCVMLVDDEVVVREMCKAMLKQLGYKVLTAHDGADALRIYRECRDRIDLVILDLVMPIMNGRDTFRKLRAINPDVRVLVASGYSIGEDVQTMLDEGAVMSLPKPFAMKELSAVLHEILA